MDPQDAEPERHGERKVRKSGSSVEVTIPPEAVENSGLEPGDSVTVMSMEDGAVVLVPYTLEDAVRDTIE